MKRVALALKWLGHAWSCLFVLSILISIIGDFITEPTVWLAWRHVTSTFDPMNIANDVFMVIVASPALGLYWLSDRLGKPAATTTPAA